MWIKIKIETAPEGIDIVSAIFEEAGLVSLEIEDSREFLEVLESTKERWDFVDDALYEEKSKACSVAAYVTDTDTGRYTIDLIKSKVAAAKVSDTDKVYGSLEVCVATIDEEDWAESWKKYYKPIPVGKNILICPLWEAVPKKYNTRTVFKIEPGMSFGTGTHETTRLCIAALERHIKCGDSVLDLGCGSGILSIIAALLGAKSAVAADIDENCAKIAEQNAKINEIQDKYSVYAGDVLKNGKLQSELKKKKYELVLANIVPNVIIALLPFIKEVLAEGGIAILSGIIGIYLPDVEAAVKSCGFKILEVSEENDWHCVEVSL